jgi:UDP-N-acetylglucosamine:LPS N-acetylglucosamine transferase
MKKYKICVTCSAGGHFAEAIQLLPLLKNYDVFFFTFYVSHIRKSLKNYKIYYTLNPKRNPLIYIRIFLKSLIVLLKEKPKVIISTGAGSTVPISLLGKLFFKTRLIYIDCSAQVNTPSLTGRIIYRIADLFFVQWKSLKDRYGDKAIYGGLLI